MRHPLMEALVAAGATERDAASTALGLRKVLGNVDRDLREARHPVDRAANTDLLRQLMRQLLFILPVEVVAASVNYTIAKENEMRASLREMLKSVGTSPAPDLKEALDRSREAVSKAVAIVDHLDPKPQAHTEDDSDWYFDAE